MLFYQPADSPYFESEILRTSWILFKSIQQGQIEANRQTIHAGGDEMDSMKKLLEFRSAIA